MTERGKYIIFNAGAWLAVFAAGLFLLALLRGFGTSLVARHEARGLLDQARTQLEAGNADEAQRTIVSALAVAPSVAPDVVGTFGGRLPGMPVLDDRLRQLFREDPPPEGVLAEYEMLAGDPARALELLEQYQEKAGKQPEPYLWLGRLHADHGDFQAAQKAFDTYWRLSRSVYDIGPDEWIAKNADAGPPLDRAWKMFQMGLWRQASRVVPPELEEPERLFYQALSLDMQRKPAEAAPLYAQLLEVRPTHLPALKRMQFLSGK